MVDANGVVACLSPIISECVRQFIVVHYPTSAVKQRGILERVLLFMGITAVDELCHVDKQCMGSVCTLLSSHAVLFAAFLVHLG